VIGEPERVKDDYYYRSRKAVLMHEMYERFGQLIRACRQRRGEERFESQQGSSELRSLLRECLRLFTPWDTQCSVPRDFDPLKSVIAALTSKSGADENEIEVNRIHAVLHPDCFERLVAAFGYSPPDERMELPRFFMDQSDDQSPPRPRSAPSELSAEELAEINHMLDEQAGRRRGASPGAVIRIMVDGVERGRLNPVEQSSISFSAEEDAEVIEVKSTDASGDLLLATHVLSALNDAAIVSSIRLEGGQDLSLSITRRQNDTNGGADLLVTFGYRETAPRRAAHLWWQRMKLRLKPEHDLSMWSGATIYILAGSLVIICLTAYLGYVRLRSPQTSGPAPVSVAQAIPPTQPEKPVAQATVPAARPPKRERSTAAKVSASPAPAQTREEDAAEDLTRGGAAVPNLTLKQVKKIYIEIRGDAALRSNLVESLNSSGVVTITTNADEADAALKIVVSENSTSALLVNARGTILWRRHYSGDANNIASDLLSQIRH